MQKTGKRQRCRSAAAANGILRLVDDDVQTGTRQRDRRGQSIRTRAHDYCICRGHVFAITPCERWLSSSGSGFNERRAYRLLVFTVRLRARSRAHLSHRLHRRRQPIHSLAWRARSAPRSAFRRGRPVSRVAQPVLLSRDRRRVSHRRLGWHSAVGGGIDRDRDPWQRRRQRGGVGTSLGPVSILCECRSDVLRLRMGIPAARSSGSSRSLPAQARRRCRRC